MIISGIYEKRLERPILYSIILFIFMNISLHTLMLAGSLHVLFLIDVFRNDSISKHIIASVLIFTGLLVTILYIMPKGDCSTNINGGTSIFHIISDATIGNYSNSVLEILIAVIIGGVLVISLKDNVENIIKLIIFILPVSLILMNITYLVWHVGVIFLALFTYVIITRMIDKKVIRYLFLIIMVVQIYWTGCSINYDINNKYSASKEVARFIKQNNYQEKTIYGLGYSVTSIQPYFETNIFDNRNTDKSFYFWKKDKGYLTEEERIKKIADIYVISTLYKNNYSNEIKILKESNYTKYEFEGYTYIKDSRYEKEGFYVYIKENRKE